MTAPQPSNGHTDGVKQVWLLPLAGGRPRQITRLMPDTVGSSAFCGSEGGNGAGVASRIWSPDSRSIAFLSSFRHYPEFAEEYDIDVVNADGSGVHPALLTPRLTCDNGARSPKRVVGLLGWAP